jgi:hypothetical protein
MTPPPGGACLKTPTRLWHSHSLPVWIVAFIVMTGLMGIGSLRDALPAPGLKHEAGNGAAALTYRAPVGTPFIFAADLDLPRVAANQSWYAVWLMIAELKNTAQPSMLQIGLIRWDQSGFEMQPFVASEHSSHPELNFTPLPIRLSGVHRFAISSNSMRIDLRMDGRVIKSSPRRDFFTDSTPTYLKVAAEVFADGDKASARLSNIQVQVDSAEARSPTVWEAYEDRGLKFQCHSQNTWEAIGRFDPALPFTRYFPRPCP